ncbi:translocation protein SEC62 [Ctenocephalides felis]|uniref:translocation protein SEC62 n=1 Tax=Ctenocephalides felis TaxID=7515 RepID=UPI000E6E52ED|nr:translocation protein SEC62 [Ctenocephalides felis]
MAEKKRGKKRKDEYTGPGGTPEEVEKPSKDEYTIAKWLRKNVPTKKTKFINHNVEYFTSSKALDALMASKFGGEDALLPTREFAIEFMNTMLRHKFFHRAVKVPVSEQELKNRKKGDKSGKKPKESKEKKIEKPESQTEAQNSNAEGKDKMSLEPEKEKEKRKRKIRLEMHLHQVFVDGSEAYVWIYDPIPLHYWIFGTLLVLGAIGVCLFPLWPPTVRKGVYYLSIAAAGFLVFIIALTIIRLIIFCIIWIITLGKHHLWLFPNLTEDVGFFASFWPLYKYEYKGGEALENTSKKKKKKKDKYSDNEDEVREKEINISKQTVSEPVESQDNECQRLSSPTIEVTPVEPSESESESSQRSSTGKDFEMVDANEVDTS